MEGPTPISALIHAATMVAAGVYLVARTYEVFLASPLALEVVAYVGAFTALFAATIAVAQNDLKRVLAYSTISQLGYMMLAMGLGSWAAYSAGIFHLFTHAFFKALLFLGAGSVIHAIHRQDIFEMGGLGKTMKVTMWTFAVGALALSGLFPLSGFWSKDAILSEAFHHENPVFFIVGLVAAFFTAFYMARLFFLVFAGQKPFGHGCSRISVRDDGSVGRSGDFVRVRGIRLFAERSLARRMADRKGNERARQRHRHDPVQCGGDCGTAARMGRLRQRERHGRPACRKSAGTLQALVQPLLCR